MGEADPKKSCIPDNDTLLFTLVIGFSTSTSCVSFGIVSKNNLSLSKFFCDKFSKNSVNSSVVLSLAG